MTEVILIMTILLLFGVITGSLVLLKIAKTFQQDEPGMARIVRIIARGFIFAGIIAWLIGMYNQFGVGRSIIGDTIPNHPFSSRTEESQKSVGNFDKPTDLFDDAQRNHTNKLKQLEENYHNNRK